MKTKHSPGPWRYRCEAQTRFDTFTGERRDEQNHWIHPAPADASPVALIAHGALNPIADARLIAAAPTGHALLWEIFTTAHRWNGSMPPDLNSRVQDYFASVDPAWRSRLP